MTRSLILSALTCLTLSACASSDAPVGPLSTAPGAYEGLNERDLRLAINDYIAAQRGPAHSQYEYSITDLNADGRRDALVLFNLPYGHWCGWAGCTMAVFDGSGDEFELQSEIRNVRGPLVVAENSTNGWRDIIVRVTGTHMSDKNVVLQFENGTYPENPAGLTDIAQAMTEIPGKRLFP